MLGFGCEHTQLMVKKSVWFGERTAWTEEKEGEWRMGDLRWEAHWGSGVRGSFSMRAGKSKNLDAYGRNSDLLLKDVQSRVLLPAGHLSL